MKTVHQILQTKGYDIWTIDPDATVYDALKLLAEKNVGALPVVTGRRSRRHLLRTRLCPQGNPQRQAFEGYSRSAKS